MRLRAQLQGLENLQLSLQQREQACLGDNDTVAVSEDVSTIIPAIGNSNVKCMLRKCFISLNAILSVLLRQPLQRDCLANFVE